MCIYKQIKHRVLEDYTERLDEANEAIDRIFQLASQAHLGLSESLAFTPTNETDTVVVYNSLAHDRSEVVRVDFVRRKGVTTIPSVVDSNGQAVPAQLKVNDEIISQLTVSASPAAPYEDSLYFVAQVPALGYATYQLVFAATNSTTTVAPTVTMRAETLTSEHVVASFDASTGVLSSIKNVALNYEVAASQNYWQYVDGVGGAYCLVEQNEAVAVAGPLAVHTTSGPIFSEVVQSYSYGNGLQQRVRLGPHDHHLEVKHEVGMLEGGRELVSRIVTNLDTQGTLFNDDSGFKEYRKRQRNETGSIAQNYHALVQVITLDLREKEEKRAKIF